MEYFAGLDVSLETVNVYIVIAAGGILLEKEDRCRASSHYSSAEKLQFALQAHRALKWGQHSSWLYGELRAAGYGAVCLECRHVKSRAKRHAEQDRPQ